MNRWVVLPLVGLLAGCTGAAMKSTAVERPSLSGLDGSMALSCHYQKRITDDRAGRQGDFYFWREARRVETRDQLSGQGEIWERDPSGKLFYTHLFFPEHVALEYMPGDLATTGSTATWEQVAALTGPAILGQNPQPQGRASFAGIGEERYAGNLGETTVEIDWLPSLNLPSRILQKSPKTTVELVLAECTALSQGKVKPITAEELHNLRHIDFSDLGDMESDPVVQHISELMGGHHHDHPEGH